MHCRSIVTREARLSGSRDHAHAPVWQPCEDLIAPLIGNVQHTSGTEDERARPLESDRRAAAG
jgi:hypothetical protein